MSTKHGALYVRVVVSYGEPTELDDVGCDGMFIESTETCTKDVANLLRVARAGYALAAYIDEKSKNGTLETQDWRAYQSLLLALAALPEGLLDG